MIDKIMEGLYISDAASVISGRGKQQIKELNITHILTTSGMPIPKPSKMSNVQYKFVFMMDTVSQDILGANLLEIAIGFIDNAIKSGGRIIVHCEVGVSRSVAVVAGYLMKKFEWNPSKAILYIQKSRPIACPNSSFVRQLSIFRELGYKADPESLSHSAHYRHFCGDTGNIPHMQVQTPKDKDQDEHRTLGPHSRAALFGDSRHKRYKCRRCRTDIFYDIHILKHSLGGSMDDERNDSDELQDTQVCGFDYLITPMKWMTCEEYQGKILCSKCGEKLGQYIWGGRECQGEDGKFCGRHVTPWVHIQKSKVDECVMNQLAARLAHLPVIVPPGKTEEMEETERIVMQ
ncbi:hypothetical protein FO519_004816 [Halicephalobus sp. NKZ332]|nr:hypothetical protein FO519_004816 [Halicephalobus sp. NKZ332]